MVVLFYSETRNKQRRLDHCGSIDDGGAQREACMYCVLRTLVDKFQCRGHALGFEVCRSAVEVERGGNAVEENDEAGVGFG